MAISRRVVAPLLASVVVLATTGPAAGAPDVLRVGNRFKVHPHVTTADFDGNKHNIEGRVGLRNTADRGRRVKCRIVATLKAQEGGATVKGDDFFRTHVGANTTKRVSFDVEIRDDPHRFQNDPWRVAGHCHTPYRN